MILGDRFDFLLAIRASLDIVYDPISAPSRYFDQRESAWFNWPLFAFVRRIGLESSFQNLEFKKNDL